MTKSHHSPVSSLARRYLQSKTELQKALISASDLNLAKEDGSISELENILENSFEALIAAQATNIDELLIKAQTLMYDTLSEAELASYHKQAMLTILEDISTLKKER